MPINPNIPLSVQQSRFGEIAVQGITAYKQRERQKAADERAEAALELRKGEVDRKAKVEQDNANLTNFANFYQTVNKEGDIPAQFAAEKERVVPGSFESESLDEFMEIYNQNPAKALQAGDQMVGMARQKKLISPDKGSQINILVPGEQGIKPGVVNDRGQIVHPKTRQLIPGAIKAPSTQETGGPGSLTGSQEGKVEVENIELEKSVTKTIQKAETIKQLVMSPDFRGGITGDATSFVNSGMAQIRQSFGTESIIVGNKLDESRIDPSQISTENLTRFRRSARNNDRFDAAILDLAYTLATIRDPGGRLSDKDVNAAEKTLRSGADRASIIALLGDAQKRAAQDFNTETKIINKRLGKSFPLINLEDVTGKKPVESDDDMANRILQRLNK